MRAGSKHVREAATKRAEGGWTGEDAEGLRARLQAQSVNDAIEMQSVVGQVRLRVG